MMNEQSIFWLNLAALEEYGKQHTSDPYNSIWFRFVGIITFGAKGTGQWEEIGSIIGRGAKAFR